MDFKICSEAIRWALKHINYSTFADMMNEYPRLGHALRRGGFKLTPNSFREPPTVQRITAIISNDTEFSHLTMLAVGSNNNKLASFYLAYGMLSDEWLLTNWRSWIRTLEDPRPVILSFMVDDRKPAFKKLAMRLMRIPTLWDEKKLRSRKVDSSKTMPHIQRYREALRYFRLRDETTAAPESADTPATAAPASPQNTLTKHPTAGLLSLSQNTTQQAENKEVEPTNNKKFGQLRNECERLQKELKIQANLHKSQLEEKDKEYDQLVGELEEIRGQFQAAIAALRDEHDAALKQEQASFEAVVLGVHPDLEAYAQEQHKETGNIKERVKNALNAQRENNRRYGTRQQLREEIDRLNSLLKQVRYACEEAITLTPELPKLQTELENRITEIQERLREDSQDNELPLAVLPTRLTNYVREIPFAPEAFRKFDDVQKIMESDLGKSLLPPEEQKALTLLLERRRGLCRRALEPRLAPAPSRTSETVAGEMQFINQMSWFISEFPNVEVFVDGYNVLKRDPHWSSMQNNVAGLGVARNNFIECCERVAKLFKHLTLVFDSDLTTGNIEHRGNLTIVFVAKLTEDQNADNYLVETLQTLKEKDLEENVTSTRWLVTDDFELRLRVQECCDAIVIDSAFAAFVK